MIRCAKCGSNNPDDNNFCDQCGVKLESISSGNANNRKYANNPFEEAASSPRQPNPKPSEKPCIMCHGEGRVQEPGPDGVTMVTKTCPLCQGRRVLTERPAAQKSYNNPFNDTVNPGAKTSTSDYESKQHTTNNTSQYPQKKKMGIKETNKLAIVIIVGLVILFYIYAIVKGYNSSQSSNNTVSKPSGSTPVESSSNNNYEILSDTEIVYKDLSIEIPAGWVELTALDDTAFRYGDSISSGCSISGSYMPYDSDSSFEQNKETLISDYLDDLNNGTYDVVGYVECTVSDHNALKVSIDVQNVKRVELYIDNGDGMIHLRFRMSKNFKTNGELISGIIDSLCFNGYTPAESTESPKEIEYISSTFNGLSFEYPVTWFTVHSTDVDPDEIYYSDPNDYEFFNYIYLGYFTGSFDDDVKNDWINYYSEKGYDLSYSDSGLENQFAWYCTWIDDYDTNNIEYVVNVDNGYIDFIFTYSLDQEEELLPIYEYIIDSITVEGADVTEETEPTASSIDTIESEQMIEPTDEITETIELEPLFPDVDIGDTVIFGSFKQDSSAGKDPIEWIVLENNENGMLLLSKYVLTEKVFYSNGNVFNYDDAASWKGSNIRSWLNNTFYNNSFTAEEKSRIITDSDSVFLLSVEDVETYLGHGSDTEWGFYTKSSYAACQATEYAEFEGIYVYDDGNVSWCLSSSGIDDEGNDDTSMVAYIDNDGFVHTYGSQVWGAYGIRPAIWIIP